MNFQAPAVLLLILDILYADDLRFRMIDNFILYIYIQRI